MTRVERIGDATVILGDCHEIMHDLGTFDALLTDPPYGIGASFDVCRHGHGSQAWDSEPVGIDLLNALIGKASASIIWGGNYYNLPPSRCFLVWDKCQPFDFSLAMAEMAWASKDANAKIFRYRPQAIQKQHPTQKPVALMRWCIEQLPADVETILDPFAGSGTTGVAAIQMGKKPTLIEREPKYFDIARSRIEQAYRQPDLFIPAPVTKPEQQKLAV